MSICELCGDYVDKPGVIGGKVVCSLCMIRQLRIMDNAPMEHPRLAIPVKPDGTVYVPTWRHKGRWTKGSRDRKGYLRIKYRGKLYRVHRLVLETFVGFAPKDRPEVDHIDRNPSNNHVSNLRWVSRTENNRNTLKKDRVEARGLPHTYDDADTYNHGSCKQYYDSHRTDILEQKREYRKLNKVVQFSDGALHWVPRDKAEELLKLPVCDRHFNSVRIK